MTQQDIRAIINQLETDIIERMRMIPAPYDASSERVVESTIRSYIKSALERWAPESKTNSSSQAEEAVSLLPAISDRDPNPLHKATPQSSNALFDIPHTLSQLPNTCPETSNPKYNKDRPLRDILVTKSDEFASIYPRRIGKNGWKKHYPTLRRLYMEEQKDLATVMSIMAEKYNFKATPKQYRYQLGVKWNWKKYNATRDRPHRPHLRLSTTTTHEFNGRNGGNGSLTPPEDSYLVDTSSNHTLGSNVESILGLTTNSIDLLTNSSTNSEVNRGSGGSGSLQGTEHPYVLESPNIEDIFNFTD
ncbi:hypothetical protein F5Y12DRAFT_779755 [Xylaria sp. FL1777]|nr:hypothetical protein F5Y12DRAFT_779755 [Xylaria sp. FL1777]